jgi:hypothetical protein
VDINDLILRALPLLSRKSSESPLKRYPNKSKILLLEIPAAKIACENPLDAPLPFLYIWPSQKRVMINQEIGMAEA